MKALNRGFALVGPLLSAALTGGCASISSSASTDIERPVETAWAVFADVSRRNEWLHDWGDMPWADAGPEAIGRVDRVELGKEDEKIVLMQTITSIEENEEYAFNWVHEWADLEHLIRFEPRGANACTVQWNATIHPKGLWNGVWMNASRGSIEARFTEHLAKLKAAVEVEPARVP